MRWVLSLLYRIWPDLRPLRGTSSHNLQTVIISLALALLLVPVGLVWLAFLTDFRLVVEHWPLALLVAVGIFLAEEVEFFYSDETEAGVFTGFSGTIGPIVYTSGALLFGPVILWVRIGWSLVNLIREWQHYPYPFTRLHTIRVTTAYIVEMTPLFLIGLILYQRSGGTYPIEHLDFATYWQGLSTLMIGLLISRVVWMIDVIYRLVVGRQAGQMKSLWLEGRKRVISLFTGGTIERSSRLLNAISWGWPLVALPFGVLGAGVYGASGSWAYAIYIGGFLLVGFMARQLSFIVHRMQQRTRELQHLDALSQAFITAPPDASTLAELLTEHMSGMYLLSIVSLRLFEHDISFHYPSEYPEPDDELWQWARTITQPCSFRIGHKLPWGGDAQLRNQLVVPIVRGDDDRCLGAIHISRRSQRGPIEDIIPATQSLASLIASAIQSAETYEQSVMQRGALHELAVAGEIQATFLPDSAPQIEGWDFSATVEPAREASGDFFDIIPLPGNRVGIVIADVADKGVGAALYMSLSRTLVRIYLTEYLERFPDHYDMHPERVLHAVNHAILRDTRSQLFVTIFLGVIDTRHGRLAYANAGHNPPLLFKSETEILSLKRTGVPIGLFIDRSWDRAFVDLDPGDLLVLYTDGVTDAENKLRDYYGENSLRAVIKKNLHTSSRHVREVIIANVHRFMGQAPQVDDITLLIVKRTGGAEDDLPPRSERASRSRQSDGIPSRPSAMIIW